MIANSAVLIYGAGQIGSRHLQGLAKCPLPLRIYVVDIDPNALVVARQRWAEVSRENRGNKEVSYHARIKECAKEFELVFVATSANKRVEFIASIKEHALVRYWILEKVLVQSSSELDQLLEIFDSNPHVWVNLPRRMLTWHSLIRNSLVKNFPIHLKVLGKAWGLACNSIHYLDMVAWFSGEFLVEVTTEGLDKDWIKAKRLGYWEALGELKAQFSGKSTATLTVEGGEAAELWYHFDLNDGQFIWRIDEEMGVALRSDGFSIPGRLPYQSEVTPLLVEQILLTGQCDLPTLSISAQTHRVFLDGLLDHWRRTFDATAVRVPIT